MGRHVSWNGIFFEVSLITVERGSELVGGLAWTDLAVRQEFEGIAKRGKKKGGGGSFIGGKLGLCSEFV